MATYDELIERAMEAPTWVKAVETFAEILANVDYNTACSITDTAFEAVNVMRQNQVNGTENDEMKLRRRLSREIWQHAKIRKEWIELQPDFDDRRYGRGAYKTW